MTTVIKMIASSALGAVLLSAPALAQEKQHRLAPCKADVEKFCAGEQHGQGKIRPCLENNKDKLTPECKTALELPRPPKNQ